jgi:hypothetical protein
MFAQKYKYFRSPVEWGEGLAACRLSLALQVFDVAIIFLADVLDQFAVQ